MSKFFCCTAKKEIHKKSKKKQTKKTNNECTYKVMGHLSPCEHYIGHEEFMKHANTVGSVHTAI